MKLSELKTDKTSLETELNNIRLVISSDVSAFKKLAGVPTLKEKRRERIIGFISGIIASVVAAGIIWGIAEIIRHYFVQVPQ